MIDDSFFNTLLFTSNKKAKALTINLTLKITFTFMSYHNKKVKIHSKEQ